MTLWSGGQTNQVPRAGQPEQVVAEMLDAMLRAETHPLALAAAFASLALLQVEFCHFPA